MRKSRRDPSLLTAKQVKEILGINESTLYTYVKNGALHRKIPPGKKYGMYLAEEVNDLKHFHLGFVATAGRPKSTFSRAEPDDMEEIARLVYALFDTYPNVERWTSWLLKNPEIGYTLKVDDKIMGCAFIMPLTQQKINEVLANQITPSIVANDVGMFEPGVPLYLYVRTVGIQPNIPHVDKRIWGARLIAGLIKMIIEMGARGIDIRQIISRSETPDGIRILRHMGFTEIPTITTSRNFVIDVATSGIPAINDYKQALLQWQQEHGSLVRPQVQQSAQPVTPVREAIMSLKKATATPAIKSDRDSLPDGLLNFTKFYRQHRISDATAGRARIAGKYQATQGRWHDESGHVIQWALDQAQQRAFCQYFKLYSPDAKLVECNDPTCVCHSV